MLISLFKSLFFMSIQAALLIMVIILIRVLFSKVPKKYICMLWCLAALRLMLPVTIESNYSLMPDKEQLEAVFVEAGSTAERIETEMESGNIMQDDMAEDEPENAEGIPLAENLGDSWEPVDISAKDQGEKPVKEQGAIARTVSTLWAAGVILLLGYGVFGYVKTKCRVREAVHEQDNIWLCDHIDTPFLLGYIRPQIYIPFHVNVERRDHIIAHEQSHIARGDHITKLIGYILLSVYWFQPMVWIAYVLFSKDVEMACDERVIAGLGEGEKKNYSQTLLVCSVDRYHLLGNPLAFGEIDVKKRIQNVLRYKKPRIWMICGAIALLIMVSLLFMTSRSWEEPTEASREKWTGEDGEIFMYSHRADITHDGIMDLVVFTIEPHPEVYEELPAELENYTELDAVTLFQKLMAEGHIYVYKGSDGKGNYEKTPLWHKGEIYWAHTGNAQISVLEEKGKGYLLDSNMYMGMDAVDYSYRVFSLDNAGNEETKDKAGVSFYAGKFDYSEGAGDLTVQMPSEAEKLKAFQEKMEPWLKRWSTVLLVATDLSVEPCVFWSEENSVMYASEYYKWIWNRWFESEIEPEVYGYVDYTGYMDACRVWTDYQRFVDQDYDGDGLVDRVYRRDKREVCDYRIEFGNGDVILLEDAALGEPVIKSGDLNQDGAKEILFTLEYPFDHYPGDYGNLVLLEKVGGEYREAELPFATDPEEKWRTGLTINHDFIEKSSVCLTVEETGTQVEMPYQSIEGVYDDYREIRPIYKTRFVQGEDGPYLECMLSTLYRGIELKLVYEGGEYVIKDFVFAQN